MVAGTVGVCLLLPPPFSFRVDSAADVGRVLIFVVTAAVICAITFGLHRRSQQLQAAARSQQHSQQWLAAAQQLVRFWTWEINPETERIKWANPYNELESRESAPLDIGLSTLSARDRARFRDALARAAATGELSIEFESVSGREPRRLLAKGRVVPDVVTGAPRLLGVTIELPPSVPNVDPSTFHGLDDLLSRLESSASLDHNARLNIALARQALNRIVAHTG